MPIDIFTCPDRDTDGFGIRYRWLVARCRLCGKLILIRTNDDEVKNLDAALTIWPIHHQHCLEVNFEDSDVSDFEPRFGDIVMYPSDDKPILDFADTVIVVRFRDKISKDIRVVAINEEDYDDLCEGNIEGYYPEDGSVGIL